MQHILINGITVFMFIRFWNIKGRKVDNCLLIWILQPFQIYLSILLWHLMHTSQIYCYQIFTKDNIHSSQITHWVHKVHASCVSPYKMNWIRFTVHPSSAWLLFTSYRSRVKYWNKYIHCTRYLHDGCHMWNRNHLPFRST